MICQPSAAPCGAHRSPPRISRRSRLRRYPEELGPMPEATLDCFVDLGLSDAEIARYFRLDLALVIALTRPVRARQAAAQY